MKNINFSMKYLFIPILIIILLCLGTVSASLEFSSDASDGMVLDDSDDIGICDSIYELSETSLDSENDFSSDILNDEEMGDEEEGDEPNEKSFADIQAEIDDAEENGSIELTGTYFGSEEIKVNKNLTFIGKDDKAVIKTDNPEYIFDFTQGDPKTIKFENIKFISNSTNLKSWISASGDIISFENCIFENIAVGLDNSEGSINNCQFIKSSILLDYWWGTVTNSNFTKNSGIGIGNMCKVGIYNCNFSDGNYSAISSYTDTEIINCTFKNFNSKYGGAINIDGIANVIKNCVFINNTATEYGGAIYVDPWGGALLIENCSFFNNSAKLGSAIAWNSSDTTEITNCIFDNNKALDSNSINATLYFINDYLPEKDFSKLNITANNNFWGLNNVVLNDIFKSKKGETFNLANILTLRLKSNGNNEYTIYFANSSGSKVSEMPNYSLTLKDRRTGSIIAKDLLLENGEATFEYDQTLNMDVIDIINQGGKSVTKLSTTVSTNKLVTYYRSGRTFNIKVVDKYSKKPISGIKLNLKVYTGKNYKYYYVTTNSSGIAVFKASSLSIGTHKVEITSSNKRYSVGKTNSTIQICKARTIVSAPKITAKYRKSYYFKVTVKHNSTKKYIRGLKLKLKIYTGKKYKSYYVKTNTNGLAIFNTKYLKRGYHKVLIVSANGNFIVSKSSSIRIK